MRLIHFSFKELLSLVNKEIKVVSIILLSLAITFAASLILIKAMLESNATINEADQQKRSYYLHMEFESKEENIGKSYEIINSLLYGKEYPEIKEIDGITLDGIEMLKTSQNTETNITLKAVLGGDLAYLTEYKRSKLLSGKWFTDKEPRSNAKTIILSQDIKQNFFSDCNVGSKIHILGNEFIVRGITSDEISYVPYSCIQNIENFKTKIKCIKFAKELSTIQKKELQQKMDELGTRENIKSEYEIQEFDYYSTYILYMILIAGILFFCICNIVSLFRYISIKKLYDFNIYKICGMKEMQYVCVFFIQVLSLQLIGCLLGSILYKCSIPLQNYFQITYHLSSWMVWGDFAVMTLLLIGAVYPSMRKLSKRPPLDRVFWK